MIREYACVAGVGWVDGAAAPGTPCALTWSDFSDRPFNRFERLDLLSQYAAAAVARCGVQPIDDPDAGRRTAIVLATQNGSLDIDARFIQSFTKPGGPSPMCFSYTLPSSPLAAISIHFRITGPALCLMPTESALAVACTEGLSMIDEGAADRVICLAADAADPAVVDWPWNDDDRGPNVGTCHAVALDLVSSDRAPGPHFGASIVTRSDPAEPSSGPITLPRLKSGSRGADLALAQAIARLSEGQALGLDMPWPMPVRSQLVLRLVPRKS